LVRSPAPRGLTRKDRVIAANLTQIIDSLSASPTVLLDLNNENPWGVSSFSAPTPQVSYSDSNLRQSWYANSRSIELALDQVNVSQDTLASNWQTLARLLDQERFWLKYQPTGATSPVFFNCYRSQVPDVFEVPGATAYRTLTVQITADPFAYGLPESGSVTINNDPVAGTNPCFWRVGTGVKGDVPTPLFVTTGAQTDLGGRGLMVATSALRYGLSQTTPLIVQLPPASGVTLSGLTAGSGDALMSGGNYWRRTSTGVSSQTANALWNPGVYILAGAIVGDYHVMLRYRTSAPGVEWSVTLSQFDVAGAAVTGPPGTTESTFAGWIDLGVFRWPLGAPEVDTAFGTTPASAGTRIRLDLSLPAGSVAGDTFDFDCLMFVPAGLDQAASNTTAFVAVPSQLGATSASLVLDRQGDRAYLTNSGGQIGTLGYPSYVGGLPYVVPNADNSLTWLRAVSVGFSAATDTLAATTVLNWSYNPRYLYVRPATT
jgi:hypothetical protein